MTQKEAVVLMEYASRTVVNHLANELSKGMTPFMARAMYAQIQEEGNALSNWAYSVSRFAETGLMGIERDTNEG